MRQRTAEGPRAGKLIVPGTGQGIVPETDCEPKFAVDVVPDLSRIRHALTRESVVPVLDAKALNSDVEGLGFLRRVLGEQGPGPSFDQRFSVKRFRLAGRSSDLDLRYPVAPAPESVEPRFAEALA